MVSRICEKIEKIKNLNLLTKEEIFELCENVKYILINEENVLTIDTPIYLCGDIHGQFDDLLYLFIKGGDLPYSKYLFMGDIVDRGYNSVESLILLLLLKVRFPDCIYLIRGNHESRAVTSVYGFYDECISKYNGLDVWRCFTDLFDYMSLAALIDGEYFCVHGGLSPHIHSIDEIRALPRVQEPPQEGPIADLLWSDPDDIETWGVSERGAGYLFGNKIVNEFIHNNNIKMICRAHQLIMEGYKYMFNDTVVTVWSAPNYCYRMGNVAAIMKITETSERSFILFNSTHHSSFT